MIRLAQGRNKCWCPVKTSMKLRPPQNVEKLLSFFFLSFLALQTPLGVVFYSPLVGFSLLAYEVS